jgi:hypothetical protein
MGCLKLAYKNSGTLLKVAYRKPFLEEKSVQRFLSVDPLAHKLPGYSPYAMALNNPLLYIDPDGQFPFTFHVRTFAPFDWFGGGFKGDGDNRRFTTGQAAFKIRSEIDIETDNMSVTRANVYGTKSVGGYGLWDAKSEAHGNYSFKEGNLKSHLYGNNDAATEASSDIDVFSALKVGVSAGKNESQILTLSGQLSGDKFPAAEAFVKDAQGNSVFLGASPAGAGAVIGPYGLLPGENKRPMMNVNISISVNKDGVFQGVMQNNKLIKLEDWNKKFEKTDPK